MVHLGLTLILLSCQFYIFNPRVCEILPQYPHPFISFLYIIPLGVDSCMSHWGRGVKEGGEEAQKAWLIGGRWEVGSRYCDWLGWTRGRARERSGGLGLTVANFWFTFPGKKHIYSIPQQFFNREPSCLPLHPPWEYFQFLNPKNHKKINEFQIKRLEQFRKK